MNWRLSSRVHLGNDRVSVLDAARQERTAAEILRRFDEQPGIVLADEVGMGKTYVALAVAASVIEATKGERPVVIMVPAGVQAKWPREWSVFEDRCLTEGSPIRVTSTSVTRGSEFLKLLDDPPNRRSHIIFLTHGALTNSLSDPFVKLAIVRRALMRKSLARQRRAFPRWAGSVLASSSLRSPMLVDAMLDDNPRVWRRTHGRLTGVPLPDDPVPGPILDALGGVDLRGLAHALSDLPLREGKYIDARLKLIRVELARVLRDVWRDCLTRIDLELPLLILDEAHHVKNPGTALASLFASKEAQDEADLLRGPLGRVFDRMLFLTATPFQLGHHELIEVLRRFSGVRWSSPQEREAYEARLEDLAGALNRAQTAALRLERSWARLRLEDVTSHKDGPWWEEGGTPELDQVARHYADAKERLAESQVRLAPFVIRHVRPNKDARRAIYEGAAIIPGNDVAKGRGLAVAGPATLPFLLAARVQSLVAAEGRLDNRPTRTLFADGLASSFEAYRQTRLRQEAAIVDDTIVPAEDDASREVAWYLSRLDSSLPVDGHGPGAHHPKIEATVARVADLWEAGEKALVFCFYIATGRALRAHISDEIQTRIVRRGAERLGLKATHAVQVQDRLRRVGERFFAPNAPVSRRAHELIGELLGPLELSATERDRCVDIAIRFFRTGSFLVRYVDLSDEPLRAVEGAFDVGDRSARTLRTKIEEFGRFVESRVASERLELLEALDAIQTGSYFAPAATVPDPGEAHPGRESLLPNVRLANGQVQRALRTRLMLAFNTPFFPEVLIASSVMGEGVDLHLECRHVIHHDLDWNPSVLEQRTGRVDRLGSKAEVTGHPILIFEPFVEGTQDEKQFRVVKDRERWFNVVMGERMQLDEWSTDQIAARVPFPHEAASALTLKLDVDAKSPRK